MSEGKGWRDSARGHGFIPRPKKRHGVVRRGGGPAVGHAPCLVPAGVACHARRDGEKKWRPHVMRAARTFDGHAWRNEDWIGFKLDGWELKVERRLVSESTN